jgi:hypothetical protein
MPNDFLNQDRVNEIRRQTASSVRYLGEIEISASGTKIAHGLKTMPIWVDIKPYKHRGVVVYAWWYYQKPDANYLYIQAAATGRFLVTVGG